MQHYRSLSAACLANRRALQPDRGTRRDAL